MNKGTARVVIGLIALITCYFVYSFTDVEFDYNFEKFFPQNDSETAFFLEHRSHFETDNDFVLIGLKNNAGVFDSTFLSQVDTLSGKVLALPQVTEIFSPTRLEYFWQGPLGDLRSKPYLRFKKPGNYERDSARIYQTPELVKTYFSEDGKSLAILAKTTEYLSKEGCDSIAYSLSEIMEMFSFDEYHLAGRSTGQTYYVNMMQTELVIFMFLSFILVVVFLYLSFRSFWGIVMPVVLVNVSIIWTVGIMILTGKAIDLMLVMLPSIIFVVGMSDVVHILSKYVEEIRRGNSKIGALKVTFKDVGSATFLTSLTTAVGFLTLITSGIIPIQDFGIYTAVGVFVAFILAFTLLPAFILLKNSDHISRKKIDRSKQNQYLQSLFLWVLRNRKTVLIFSFGLIVMSLIGISRITINNYLLEDLKDDDELKQDFLFFENNFAGVRPFEMGIMMKDDYQVFDYEVIKEFDKMDAYLTEQYGVGALFSPLSVIKNANKIKNGGQFRFYKVPSTKKEYNQLLKLLKKILKSGEFQALVTKDEKLARFYGKTGDVGSRKIKEIDAKFHKFMSIEVDGRYFDYRLTGTPKLIDLNNSYLASDMIIGLFIAFFIIAIIVGILYKSVKMVVVSIIPNILPLLLIGGIMGYFGIDLKVSTSIIFTISFGIAVDDTIHFLSKMKIELSKGRSTLYALKRTFLSTGKAIIITSIILYGGFLTLVFSDFLGTFYIGLLVSLTLLFAVLSDLFLLPVLLFLMYSKKKQIKCPT